jgi:wyosine [tRNA(Phe)-imidazoG37] synthetase (radical SAM superfamily)
MYERKEQDVLGQMIKQNKEITDLNVTPVWTKLRTAERNSLRPINKMHHNSLPKIMKKLQTKKQKEPGETVQEFAVYETGRV